MKARILSIALSALISAACLSPAADRLSAEAVSKWELEGGYTEYSDHNDGEYGLDYYIYPDHAVLVQATWDWSGIIIPKTVNGVPVTAIADEAFMGQTSSYIEIPSTVTDLGNSLSELATTLTLEVDPGNKSYINTGDAVYTSDMKELIRCSSFYEGKEFIIPDTVEKIDSKAFFGIKSIEKISIPASVSEIGDSAFSGCENLQSIEVNGDNKYYSSRDGVLFNKCMDILYLYPCAYPDTSYTIPDSVKEIYDEAFSFCDNLETVSFGSSVEVIGYSAFSACDKLNNIVLPDSLEEIKDFAFFKLSEPFADNFFGQHRRNGKRSYAQYSMAR